VAGLSAEEAAQAMGRRAGTIRGLTFRAISALRRHMSEAEIEEPSDSRAAS
jgi:DNA-directed RNA polymerase specialized sigma24 family protein